MKAASGRRQAKKRILQKKFSASCKTNNIRATRVSEKGAADQTIQAAVPTDHDVVEYLGSPVVAGDHAYAYYADNDSNASGLARMTPPAACSGLSS